MNFIFDIKIEHIDIPFITFVLIQSMTAEVYFYLLVYSCGRNSINQPSDSYKFDEHKHG